MTKQVYPELLITKLIPVIIEKWQRTDQQLRKIFIQQDGAKNHIHEDDKEFNDALTEHDINAKLYMKELNGWSEEREEHALVVQKHPNLRRLSNGNVVIVANMAIKWLIVRKEI